MPLFNLFKAKPAVEKTTTSFLQEQDHAGLLVTAELEKALADCKTKVERIAKECKTKNRKFRDHEFDLQNDRFRCLHGLASEETYNPSDVLRVTQIFDNPQFFIDGASSNDIVQGAIGDCWFVSALATMCTSPGLVEKFCVARDEKIGVYGFIFFRDNKWVDVVIDDLLYTSTPKFEELSGTEKQLYHHDKALYNRSSRKGSAALYFARSGTDGETWVPLIEKAYAKLHGSYGALSGGWACEAIEDLTGGVTCFIPANDILDPDLFWIEELLNANHDRLFGVAFDDLDTSRSGEDSIKVSGLMGGHAYSVLRAVECKGKRFVVVRNPWGDSEWTGPWSDGSKEWTPEWLEVLPQLGHSFGDDGQFVMEYSDFLACWEQIDKTILFDAHWVMSSQWLQVTTRPLPSAWTYGDVSFTITLPAATKAVIVLSQLDDRYFAPISGRSHWTFDFAVFKKGGKDLIAQSSTSRILARSVNVELDLEAGSYVVHVRLDRFVYRPSTYLQEGIENWNSRFLSRVLTERAKSQSIAMNFNASSQAQNLPIPLDILAGQDLSELEQKALAIRKAEEEKFVAEMKVAAGEKVVEKEEDGEKTENPPGESTDKEDTKDSPSLRKDETTEEIHEEKVEGKEEKKKTDEDGPVEAISTDTDKTVDIDKTDVVSQFSDDDDDKAKIARDIKSVSEDDSIFLGLRVYTSKDAPAEICGQLRHEMELSAALAL
ncbi:cysteine proteinase [Desarmillaria tabescens]|uniref:Cysteine proteinase n=1 Tax=Armillaria tabescens TaxID=1929756 RepID=A0AA39KC54_ARMTA|nr:cysteine proteinase [Desarmillaria tabescens]KAK0457136.1 cysteine proteinase [Desarmillaria tabescens]